MADLTAREECLARVLSEPHNAGPVIVLTARNLPSAGAEDAARESVAYRLGRTRFHPMGLHTQHELQQIIPALTDDVTLVTSAYHQLRAFLTFVKALPQPWRTKIWNAPAPSSMEQLAGEFAKIDKYTEDVASPDAGLLYLKWRDGR